MSTLLFVLETVVIALVVMSTLLFVLETVVIALVVLVPILCRVSKSFRFNMIMIAYGLCITFSCILSAIASIPYGRTTNNHYRIFHYFQQSVRWLGMEVTLRHAERIESEEPFVMVANHQSAIDVFTMTHIWPKNCVVLLKHSLKYVPGFNLCTYLCHAVYIDRFNKKEAKNSLANVMDAIINHKRKVFIYPEGSRYASPDEEFLPFKMGAFVIAKRAKVPIVPVVFSTYRPFYDYASSKFERNGHIVIEALEPIDSNDFETADELAAATKLRMHEAYKRLNAELRKAESAKSH
uniref:1-acyl-sn-glycerol-3-phosphate acyltransferase n=1 Tax=Steinernema glaseri TaxID=37863 RepID=A0A1I7YNB0_9BILA